MLRMTLVLGIFLSIIYYAKTGSETGIMHKYAKNDQVIEVAYIHIYDF